MNSIMQSCIYNAYGLRSYGQPISRAGARGRERPTVSVAVGGSETVDSYSKWIRLSLWENLEILGLQLCILSIKMCIRSTN